ncbi:Rrf2 family transcriptional regulator [Candidatus Acetothermia bacterium]|nr:Rrf2 family transcriptional regulator [Candidatus Acetothermia bacterium]MBI3644076.1 Rrf2 family transcriptional regulator [Candidatus Acetothermia bacterium]
MIYSNACEYAIRAMTHLAKKPDELHLAREIAQDETIPYYFLSKILQTLAKNGLLSSTKGRGGGFQLAKAPEKISLYDIKVCIDGALDLDECAVGLARCSDKQPCPLHDTFKPLRERIRAYLKETSLAHMAVAVEAKRRPTS